MFCVSTFLMPLVWQLVIYRLLCIGIFYLARPFCNGSFDALCIASPHSIVFSSILCRQCRPIGPSPA